MIWAAIIDPPTYSTGYTQNGTSVTVTITANDKSGIHYIGYKIGSNGNWEYSPNQPQHPNSSSYTYQFTRQMAAGEYIYYFAMDNGGNYPEYALYFDVIIETVSTPSTPTGSSSGKVGQSLSFSTGGSSSNLGHSVEYQFDWGDGTQSGWGSSTQSHSYSSTGTKYVKAHSRCQTHTSVVSGWSSTKYVSISYCTLTINVSPSGSGNVSKSPNKTDYTYNETVQLTANANPGYQFDHWGGHLSGSDNPESLNMNGDKNITAYFTEVAPIANFGADTTYGSEPLTVQFSDSSTGIINTWKWDFGDGQDSTGQNPIHTYNKADTFTVSLMVTGPGGSDTTKRVDYIIVTLGSGIENLTGTVQSEYQLYQNYPNPFNPSTTISYLLPKNEILTLEIIDISGKVIQTLVNETQSAGYYSVKWNASNVSSGIYIYRIDAGNFSSMKKCLLIK
jgi:PKD repeat protein